MVIELAGGLFALGGVALTALFGEVRARREARAREAADLMALKRTTYATALQQVELVASGIARWIDADPNDDAAAKQEFWEALTSAYQTSNEIRIMSKTQDPANSMKRVLTEYRNLVEANQRILPKPRELRDEMIRSFRQDLGMRE